MKKWVIGMVALMLMLTPLANGSVATRDPRVGPLIQRVNALQSQVARLTDAQTCFMAFQLNVDGGFLNIFDDLVGLPESANTDVSDNGACARVGLPPQPAVRSLQSANTVDSRLHSLAAGLEAIACTHATIGGKAKCLARGQFCSLRYRTQYQRYGFTCQPIGNGRGRLH